MSAHQIEFRPAAETPAERGEYLLYNRCDGYHLADAVFIDGAFVGFMRWGALETLSPDVYRAWAKLPESVALRDTFDSDDEKEADLWDKL